MVDELVRLHGGSIEVQSTPGVGSRFTVSLPTGRAHRPPERVAFGTEPARSGGGARPFVEEAASWIAGDQGGAASSDGASELPPGTRRAHALVVDDNADMRRYLRRLLERRGWSVDTVPDGVAALAHTRARCPDLVLADMMMPALDGFGLLRALRADATTKDVPVVLLSARAGEEARIEGFEAGANDYLVKPFTAKELVSRVAAQIELARANAEAREARSRLHAQLMQAPFAVCILRGPELVYELANSLYLETVGRKHAQVIGQPMRCVFPELPADAHLFQMLEGAFRSGTSHSETEYRVPLDRGAGRIEDAFFQFMCQPIRDPHDCVVELMVVAVV